MKKEERELALLPTQFKVPGSDKFLDISTLDETAPEVYNTVYYKEYPIVTGDMDETVIITYSPKYKAYQQRIRAGQIERAIKIMQSPDKARKGKILSILPVSFRKQQLPVTERSHRNRFPAG